MYSWRLTIFDKLMNRHIGHWTLFLSALIGPVVVNAQCAMCKAVAESNANSGGPVADGLNSGILYLMFFPYLLALVVAVLWYRHNKKSKSSEGQRND